MFADIVQPLAYAEALLGTYSRLSQAAHSARLLGDFAGEAAKLSGCELAQVYLLDASHSALGLSAESLDGLLQPREVASLPADYHGGELLQFSLCQNRAVSVESLGSGLYPTDFLPACARGWDSLLCVPLVGESDVVEGLLVCASAERRNLQGFSQSFGQLGRFVMAQFSLLQRLRGPGDSSVIDGIDTCASGYGLIGKSAVMRHTYQLISKVLHSPYTVLLNGETGTGKEVVARAIHDCSPRRTKAFIVQNCAAFPENLLESELFGYRRGAFTGADRDREGLFDAAEGGTLLLDEIGDMPLALQAKLLRVLQEGEIRPLGSNDSHKINVRIIAATHRDLQAMVAQGLFREDLYYRLAQFPIELPPLRQRENDILELARHFAVRACAFLSRDLPNWSDAALDHLCSYGFPGNVRELKGMVERAVLLCEGGEFQPEHFTLRLDGLPIDRSLNLRERMEQVERTLLLDCLRKNDGNRTLVARELGLPRRTLLYRLGRLNITDAESQA